MRLETSDNNILAFHMNNFSSDRKNRNNANAYYSPGVDRFFAVDSFDPYTSLEIAQILSSKMPGIAVCILDLDDIWFDNTTCHEYTLSNKSIFVDGSNTLFTRQVPVIRKVQRKDNIKHVPEMPLDYSNNQNYETFKAFREYSQFVIHAWHSAKICEMYFNFHPMETYAKGFFTDTIPDSFVTPADSVVGLLKSSVTTEIKKFLYYSNSSNDAMAQIEQMWQNNSTFLSVGWKEMFYKLMDIPQPESLNKIAFNQDQYACFLL